MSASTARKIVEDTATTYQNPIGHGREKGIEALHEFSHTKTIVFKHG